MAYELKAFIAETKIIQSVLAALREARAVELTEGLSLIPLDRALAASLAPADPVFEGLALSKGAARFASDASAGGRIAYVEADYLKGRDHQGSVVWNGGAVELGPLVDDTAWDPREPMVVQDRPVNRSLRALGLNQEHFEDEWDAAGLTRHLRTEDWTD